MRNRREARSKRIEKTYEAKLEGGERKERTRSETPVARRQRDFATL